MSRNLLHKTKLGEFINWCGTQGIPTRPGKGEYEMVQVNVRGRWFKVYRRDATWGEHYTVERRLEATVHQFINSQKGE